MPADGVSQLDEFRQQRLSQLGSLSDEEFAAEVRLVQASRWRTGRLERHWREHRRDFQRFLGRSLSPTELDALARDVLRSFDRMFTELERGVVTYTLIRSLPEPDTAIIVITRGGFIRTAFPTASLTGRIRRRSAIVEVTDRAKRLGF